MVLVLYCVFTQAFMLGFYKQEDLVKKMKKLDGSNLKPPMSQEDVLNLWSNVEEERITKNQYNIAQLKRNETEDMEKLGKRIKEAKFKADCMLIALTIHFALQALYHGYQWVQSHDSRFPVALFNAIAAILMAIVFCVNA